MFVKVLGHSVVAQLTRERNLFQNISLPQNVRMSFEGIPGGFARDLMWLPQYPIPRIVYLQVGENEISYIDKDDIILGILDLCHYLISIGVEFVFIGALLPRRRPRYLTISQYRRRMMYINRILSIVTVSIPRVYFKKRGFRQSLLSGDGVQVGELIANVKQPPPPVIQKVGARSVDVYVTGFPTEIPVKAFKEAFESRLQIRTLNIRRETF
ncbi:hypothetical protein ACJMK2_013581 [Sinanodonta woodiana]|uniref:Uncharacterized protein n=1 Tax=Sinanodonta woodiana TaxID=1069815 RepID=A0ABD3UYK5_SINWO